MIVNSMICLQRPFLEEARYLPESKMPFSTLLCVVALFSIARAIPSPNNIRHNMQHLPMDALNNVESTTTFHDLTNDNLQLISKYLTNVKDITCFKFVNRWLNGIVEAPPGGSKCDAISSNFTLNQFTRTAEFESGFWHDYVNDLFLENGHIADDDLNHYWDVLRSRISNVWECINQLTSDGYQLSGFNGVEFDMFLELPGMFGELMSVMKYGELHDTTFALAMIRRGWDEVLYTFGPKLVPTMKSDTGNGEVDGYHVRDIVELLQRSDEFMDAFASYWSHHANDDSVVHDLLPDVYFGLMRWTIKADNVYLLQQLIALEFLEWLVHTTGILELIMEMDDLNDYVWVGDVYLDWNTFCTLLKLRIRGVLSEKQFLDVWITQMVPQLLQGTLLDESQDVKDWYDSLVD